VAATGLLGINPYQKGVAIDIASKPINLAIQLEQKEAAKREALDKYFMDYEKTLNPSGMRQQDQDAFLSKLGEAKQYYLQNRDKILNPAKYGADAQSTYNYRLREAQSLIGQSKAQAADDKVVSGYIYQATQKGNSVPDALIPMIDASHLSIIDPRFKKIDPYSLKFDQPFKLDQFEKSIFAGVEPNKINSGYRTNSAGQVINLYKNEYDAESLKVFENRAKTLYETNPSVTKEVNRLIETGEYKSLEPYYQKLYPKKSLESASPSNVAAALALSLKQLGKTIETSPVFRPVGPREDTSGEANPLHPSSLIEEIRGGNPNYLVGGIDTTNENLIDVTSQFGGYNLYKTNTRDGILSAPALNVVYDKANDRFYVKSPSKNQEPEYLTPEAFKTKIIVNNPDISSKVKGWGKPIRDKQVGYKLPAGKKFNG
jgi:hypothetical protein